MASITDQTLYEAAAALGDRLEQTGMKLATAESCTGGWIAKALTDVPGSSAYLECGLVTYSNDAKQELLGVTPLSLDKHGAVSEAVVREMVIGALTATGADIAVSVSGVAGPDGGTAEKPVGMVWFAWGRQGEEPEAVCEQFGGDRDSVRRQAVLFALQAVRGYL
ncbi:nicotinamide-nucleotide amidase [Marinobacteraceae bacterium S3BR75-40.1]